MPGGAAEAARFSCATLSVPLDYHHRGSRTVPVAVIRVQAASPGSRIGSLVLNPGGPGGSGVDAAIDAATSLPEALRARFDIVGFDPRGVGRTGPVRCWDQARYAAAFRHARARPHPGAFRAALDEGRRFRPACRRNSGDLAPYLGTEFVARDLDRLRAALGDEQLTYLGLSYGTFIGTVYANLFPKRVRALALDGAYDPNRYANHPYAYDRGQYIAVEGALNRFLAWCAGAGTACHVGDGDPAAALDRLIGRLDRDDVAVDAFSFLYQILYAMNGGTPHWTTLADQLRQSESGEGRLLAPISRPEADFLTANTVVECNDRGLPRLPSAPGPRAHRRSPPRQAPRPRPRLRTTRPAVEVCDDNPPPG
ncbi:MAG TPA: alpha/beta fold hydrolase [Acidimicrobiia bacterium]|nr:alpha/beta fold hydrolase [Acidimicrobiia bacterium]